MTICKWRGVKMIIVYESRSRSRVRFPLVYVTTVPCKGRSNLFPRICLTPLNLRLYGAVLVTNVLLFVACANGADVVFLLDASGSVGAKNFQKVTQFVAELVEMMDVNGPPVVLVSSRLETAQQCSFTWTDTAAGMTFSTPSTSDTGLGLPALTALSGKTVE